MHWRTTRSHRLQQKDSNTYVPEMSVKIHFKNNKIATQKVEIKDTVICQKFGDGIKQSIVQTLECGKQHFSVDLSIAPGQSSTISSHMVWEAKQLPTV